MSFCQYNRKLSSILSFFGSSQWVARSGEKRPCKRERAFFLHKSSSQIGQWTDKRNNERDSHTRPAALPASHVLLVLPASLVLHTTHTKYAHTCGLLHCLCSPVHRVSRAQLPAVCTVCHRMSFAHSQARKTRNTRKSGMG